MINYLRSTKFTTNLIFAGSSMGGYGALMNSIFHKDVYCFASVPQTHLKPNGQYFKEKNPKFISKLGITINNFEELCENYPFLNLNLRIIEKTG